MADPLAVVIHFHGDPDDLLERFEQARRLWIESQGDDYERPSFYAACKTSEGIAIIGGWQSAVAHRAFGQGLHRHLETAGLAAPAHIERLRIDRLGWD